MSSLPFSPAADRNKQPILERLVALVPASGSALEIASGTGQHAEWFAAAMPDWQWQPTEAHAADVAVLAGRIAAAALPNLLPPRQLDVLAPRWPSDGPPFQQRFDAVFCANMLHIAPWRCCAALMAGSARVLAPEGRLVTYGPYLEDEVPTAPGNLAFDQSLREQNPEWGIRRREAVEQEAHRAGLALKSRHALPANNLLLVYARAAL